MHTARRLKVMARVRLRRLGERYEIADCDGVSASADCDHLSPQSEVRKHTHAHAHFGAWTWTTSEHTNEHRQHREHGALDRKE